MNPQHHSSINFAATTPVDGEPGNYAWTFLVMLRPDYAIGAAVAAKSLRYHGTKYPIWCMYSSAPGGADQPGIGPECVEFLKANFDNVVEVPLIEHDHTDLPGVKQNKIYSAWARYSFTKLHIMDPEIFPFEKVCFLDADLFTLSNIDHFFNVRTPAATFSSPWIVPYSEVKPRKYRKTIPNPYGELAHGAPVTRDQIVSGLTDSIVGVGNAVLVSPSKIQVAVRNSILDSTDKYGHTRCYSGLDEQLFADVFLLSSNTDEVAYHIHQAHNWYTGKIEWISPNCKPTGLVQYYNNNEYGKPWRGSAAKFKEGSGGRVIEPEQFADTLIWWFYAKHTITDENKKYFYKFSTIRGHMDGKQTIEGNSHDSVMAALTDKILESDLVGEAKKFVLREAAAVKAKKSATAQVDPDPNWRRNYNRRQQNAPKPAAGTRNGWVTTDSRGRKVAREESDE